MSRDIAETLASQAGLVIVSSVTKKLDILVVADPHTQSNKARKARDYGIVQVRIDDDSLGSPIDCFNTPDVITTGVLALEPRKLTKGLHKLTFEIAGKHADAVGFMVGVDYVRLVAPATRVNP